MKVRATIEVVEVAESLGDVSAMYGQCGFTGLCQKCKDDGDVVGCGRRYQYSIMKGQPDGPFTLRLSNGTVIVGDDVEMVEE